MLELRAIQERHGTPAYHIRFMFAQSRQSLGGTAIGDEWVTVTAQRDARREDEDRSAANELIAAGIIDADRGEA